MSYLEATENLAEEDSFAMFKGALNTLQLNTALIDLSTVDTVSSPKILPSLYIDSMH